MMQLEKRGIPAVAITASGFARDARRSAQNFGLPGVSLAIVPVPFTNQPPESIRTMIDSVIEEVIAGLTQPMDISSPIREIVMIDDPLLEFEGDDLLHAHDRMNQQFLEFGWSDGLPLVAPTPERVDWMLRGTKAMRGEVVTLLEPGFGSATVRDIAVNAVMAGCQPAHLPLIIAAVECIAEPKIMLRMNAMSTGPHSPLILVNGPIAREVGVNSGVCALGPGAPSYANTVVGRALRLIMMNIGHAYPGVSDMDTVGSPMKYSMCVAENETESPWQPFHVEKGFSKDASTVTVQFVYGICDLCDFQNYVPERLVQVFSTAATSLGPSSTGRWLIGRVADPRYKVDEQDRNLMLICPDHARIFAQAGWSKQHVRQALYRESQMPFRTLMLNKEPKALLQAHPELQWLFDRPDTLVPIVETPECFELAVVGGAAGRGAYLFGCGEPVTKLVKP